MDVGLRIGVKKIAIAKAALALATLVPAAVLAAGIFATSPDVFYPRHITNSTGDWGLWFLILTLCVTPVRRLTGWHNVIQFRQTLGLAAFAYSAVHVLLWAQLYWSFDVPTMLGRIVMDPFCGVGAVAFVLLIPLAVKSNRASMSRLGRRWRKIHWLTYAAMIGTLVHFWLKGFGTDVQKWIAIVAALLGFRLFDASRRRVVDAIGR